MSGLDMLEDSFPHGTVEGHRLGCKGNICPRNEIGDTCSQAAIRYAGDWEYRKAVDAGVPLPAMVHDRPRWTSRNATATTIISEPTVTVASLDTAAGRPGVLSASQVRELVRKRAEGVTAKALAVEYGVHLNTIRRNLRRAKAAS